MKPTAATNLHEILKETVGSKHSQGLNRDTKGETNFQIARDGTWFYHGSPILRKSLVRLFSTILQSGNDGTFWLVTPIERVEVAVEDAPFIAITASKTVTNRRQSIIFETNVGDIVVAGPNHTIHVLVDRNTQEPRPYIMVRPGLKALITRSVFYDLVSWAEQDRQKDQLILESDRVRFSLGSLSQESTVL